MNEKLEWYHDFIDRNYQPKSSDIVALFYFKPHPSVSIEDAVGRIASESSVGTWTTLSTLDSRIYEMRARAFKFTKTHVYVAYPLILWELGNIPQLLSGIAGNIFGMKAVTDLRLLDATLPLEYIQAFKGPEFGKDAIQKIFKKKEGPLTATVPKPKIGMTAEQHAQVAYDAWTGGIDCIKDDENLTSQSFNKFEKRVELLAKKRDQAENETGEIKDAFINVTAETHEMERRIKLLHEHQFKYFMVDVVTTGFAALQSIRTLSHDLKMAIHAHRAMHASFTRKPTHGISMLFLAKLLKLIGVDNLHIGTVIGKLEGKKKEILAMKELLLNPSVQEIPELRLPQDWGNIKGTLPVASGGLHPGLIPELLQIYNTTDLVIQVGGGIHGHPDGTKAGAMATVQAIEAYKEGIDLIEYAKSHTALQKALEKWHHIKPV